MADIIWESIDNRNETFRAKVIGGWLIRYEQHNGVDHVDNDGHRSLTSDHYTPSMVFVPDAGHTWDLDDLLKRNSIMELDLKRTHEIYVFLNMLRKTGKTNMMGAAPYLEEYCGLNRRDAKAWLTRWREQPLREAELGRLLKGESDDLGN